MQTLAVDCRMLGHSGIGVAVANWLPLCMQRMPEVHFRLIGRPDSFTVCELPENGNIVPCTAPVYSVQEQRDVIRAAKGADALWVPHYNIPLATSLPLAVTVHDVIPLALPHMFSALKRAYARLFFSVIARKAKVFFTGSEFTHNEFCRLVGTPRVPVRVVSYGVHPDWGTLDKTGLPPYSRPYYVAIGNIKEHKNLVRLCHAFAAVAKDVPQDLVLIGKREGFRSGTLDCDVLEALAPGRIHFTGALDDATLKQYVLHARALLFPSLYEGFGLPLVEAMRAGTPVVTSNIPTSLEICASDAIYFAPESQEQLQQAILRMSAMPEAEREAMIERGKKRADTFTWEQSADNICEGLREVLAR